MKLAQVWSTRLGSNLSQFYCTCNAQDMMSMRLQVAGLWQRKVLRAQNSAGCDLYPFHANKHAETKFPLALLLTSRELCVTPTIFLLFTSTQHGRSCTAREIRNDTVWLKIVDAKYGHVDTAI